MEKRYKMKIEKHTMSISQTNSFSKLVMDYVDENEKMLPFIEAFPSFETLQKQLSLKMFQPEQRDLLVRVLRKQYLKVNTTEAEENAFGLLQNQNTCTICTAHQPVIFTGHLYFIYKIMHAIKLAEQCKMQFPDYDFVPVFYMGSEDDDLQEIGAFNYNQKKYQWETPQTGACGRMSTKDLEPILQEVCHTMNLQKEDEKYLFDVLQEAYHSTNTLAEATRILVHHLFGKYGLLVVDGDDTEFKKTFIPVMEDELLQQSSHVIVAKTIEQLQVNYTAQASPRELNLFYLKDNIRESIERVGEKWNVNNTVISFNKTELLAELHQYPERFSPNVILRPLYQEKILPNIAFIGGGAELAYWMELKSLFAYHHIVYPILQLRNSILWIGEKEEQRMKMLSLRQADLFKDIEVLYQQFVAKSDTMQELDKLQNTIHAYYQQINLLSKEVNKPLEVSMLAHHAKAEKIQKRIREKFVAQIKKKDEQIYTNIYKLKIALFPNHTLQERHNNFLTLYKLYGREMFSILYQYQDGLKNDFIILQASESNDC